MSLMAGSVAVLAFPEAADASIVHVTGSPVTVFPTTNGFVDWDIDNDATPETKLFGNEYPSMAISPWTNGSIVGTFRNIPNLPTGYLVSAGKSFTDAAGFLITYINTFYSASGFTDGVAGFIGFQFQQAAQTLFGWAEIVINLGNNITITEWAYEDSGASIEVGDTGVSATTPEGDTVPALLLLGMGAAGIRTWRKRKQAKLAQDSQ